MSGATPVYQVTINRRRKVESLSIPPVRRQGDDHGERMAEPAGTWHGIGNISPCEASEADEGQAISVEDSVAANRLARNGAAGL
jgi:hypothetical protein